MPTSNDNNSNPQNAKKQQPADSPDPGAQPRMLQAPKGTRDFFPDEMIWRRHLEKTWREVSIRHGFDEIEGPTFELLDLYRVKSGDEIVSELFSFEDRGGRQLALRPEFTPTLARMVVARAASLPKPTKWFAIPLHYRAERPQRGRLREFLQWNVDMIGDDSPAADSEVLGVAIDLLAELGLTRELVRVKISHRETVSKCLLRLGIPEDRLLQAFALLDRRDKMSPEDFQKAAGALGLKDDTIARFDEIARAGIAATASWGEVVRSLQVPEQDLEDLQPIHDILDKTGLAPWCEYDLGIVRGLAYYTGTVFEIRDAGGKERAVCGGGRYDRLVETFGGPPTPACGFGMGDVVLSLMLQDHRLKPEAADIMPAPDVFLISAGGDDAEALLPKLLLDLRRAGLHARRSYRATRNVGKLLKEASNTHARFAVILGQELEQGQLVVKDLTAGDQIPVDVGQVAKLVLTRLGRFSERGLDAPTSSCGM
ncbi:MAG: histidine--tRNA ligase [Planctomycetes bacterium]|nr:histidine--tRNA ligase [Planctomycetota bacterium]NOG54635.1 histidine--tRNA ligase [Planctomycetota bacterium]